MIRSDPEIKEKGNNVMKKLFCLMLALAMLLLSATCLAEADTEETVLRVGTNPEFPPFEYVGDSGEIEGIDVEIINAIAADLGMTVQMEAMDFDALVPSLVSGKLDVAIAGMTITKDRKNSVLFSEPYFDATQVVILREDSDINTVEDLAGKKVGVQLGTTGDLMMSEPEYGVGEVSRYNKAMDAALDLQNGRLDAVVIDTLPARQFVLSLDGLIMRDDILKDAPVESYGIAVPMGQEELVEKINDSLERMMEDGTFDAILVKYVESEEAEESADATIEAATDDTVAAPTEEPEAAAEEPSEAE